MGSLPDLCLQPLHSDLPHMVPVVSRWKQLRPTEDTGSSHKESGVEESSPLEKEAKGHRTVLFRWKPGWG